MKIIAMIPARMGSKRIKNKNIRYLGDKPLINHILENAKKSKYFSEIYINSENFIFNNLAEENNVKFYKRSNYLTSDKATNDEFAADFLKNVDCDILIQLLPTSPFIDSNTIDDFIKFMLNKKLDTLISIKEVKIECLYDGKSLNFDKKKHTPPSQKLKPVYAYACGIIGWKSKNLFTKFV
jgi:CMP-N-acetylneuraminic acid synthetase|tara:strand:- start:3428 stop:3970 length:543 start_codon:yes stop_codon:yes gene_type:complete